MWETKWVRKWGRKEVGYWSEIVSGTKIDNGNCKCETFFLVDSQKVYINYLRLPQLLRFLIALLFFITLTYLSI